MSRSLTEDSHSHHHEPATQCSSKSSDFHLIFLSPVIDLNQLPDNIRPHVLAALESRIPEPEAQAGADNEATQRRSGRVSVPSSRILMGYESESKSSDRCMKDGCTKKGPSSCLHHCCPMHCAEVTLSISDGSQCKMKHHEIQLNNLSASSGVTSRRSSPTLESPYRSLPASVVPASTSPSRPQQSSVAVSSTKRFGRSLDSEYGFITTPPEYRTIILLVYADEVNRATLPCPLCYADFSRSSVASQQVRSDLASSRVSLLPLALPREDQRRWY